MPYVPIPKDLSRVKTKLALNLTKRQIVCFASALSVALPIFFGLQRFCGTDVAALAMIATCVPFFLAAMVEKNGQPFEKLLLNILRLHFLRPKARPYRTQNYYALLIRQIALEKEVNGFVRSAVRTTPSPRERSTRAEVRSQPAQSGTAQAGS